MKKEKIVKRSVGLLEKGDVVMGSNGRWKKVTSMSEYGNERLIALDGVPDGICRNTDQVRVKVK